MQTNSMKRVVSVTTKWDGVRVDLPLLAASFRSSSSLLLCVDRGLWASENLKLSVIFVDCGEHVNSVDESNSECITNEICEDKQAILARAVRRRVVHCEEACCTLWGGVLYTVRRRVVHCEGKGSVVLFYTIGTLSLLTTCNDQTLRPIRPIIIHQQ